MLLVLLLVKHISLRFVFFMLAGIYHYVISNVIRQLIFIYFVTDGLITTLFQHVGHLSSTSYI